MPGPSSISNTENARTASPELALFHLTDALYRSESPADANEAALDAIASALSCNRASVLLFDHAGVMRFVASRGLSAPYCQAVEGHSPWKLGDKDVEPIFVTDIDESGETAALKATVRGEGVRALAFIPLIADRAVIGKFMAYHDERHEFTSAERDIAVAIARQLGFSIERRRSHEALRESEERFRLVAESAPVMLWMGDAAGKCSYLNRAAREFWAVAPDRLSTFEWGATLHPEDRNALFEPFAQAMRDHTPFNVEARYRRADGVYRIVQTRAQPRFGSGGEFLGMIGVNVDISETRAAETQHRLLINELNHRVRNTLATVQSLAVQTLRSTERSADALNAFEGRLSALARAHEVLTRQSWEGAGLGDIVERALRPFQTSAPRLVANGPTVRVSPKQALAFSMALHELATNAAKYGALSREDGKIAVEWRQTGPTVNLTWTERDGPQVSPPERRGFGSRLLERNLALDLGANATIEYRPEGVIANIATDVANVEERG